MRSDTLQIWYRFDYQDLQRNKQLLPSCHPIFPQLLQASTVIWACWIGTNLILCYPRNKLLLQTGFVTTQEMCSRHTHNLVRFISFPWSKRGSLSCGPPLAPPSGSHGGRCGDSADWSAGLVSWHHAASYTSPAALAARVWLLWRATFFDDFREKNGSKGRLDGLHHQLVWPLHRKC